MCTVDWTEMRLWISPAITALGIFISVMAAIFIPRFQKARDRLAYANAAADVLADATARVWDRLEIRFDPPSYARTGRKMRQFRSDSAVSTLKDLKVSDLPIDLVASFSTARSGLSALNEAMNGEKEWPPPQTDIERYRVVYADVRGALAAFNQRSIQLRSALVELPARTSDEYQAA